MATIAGLLIVVDYAEARQDEVQGDRSILESSGRKPTRVRCAWCCSRGAPASGGRRCTTTRPTSSACFEVTIPHPSIELPAVSSGTLRLALFEASLAGLQSAAGRAGRDGPGVTPSEAYLTQIETGPGFSRPLAIQMAALVWLTSAGSAADATSVEELLSAVFSVWNATIGERSWATSTRSG